MRFSTRTRYGLRFLLRLATAADGQLIRLGQIAKEENISAGYLEQIVRVLKPLGILRSVRGSGGGYALAKHPKEINMEDIFACLEGGIAPVDCLVQGEKCPHENKCSSRDFWQELDFHIRVFLRGHSLHELVTQFSSIDDCHNERHK